MTSDDHSPLPKPPQNLGASNNLFSTVESLEELLINPLSKLSVGELEDFPFRLDDTQVVYLQSLRNQLAVELLALRPGASPEERQEFFENRAYTTGKLEVLSDLLTDALRTQLDSEEQTS